MSFARLHVEVQGPAGAPPVLFLHGLAGSARNWRPQLRALRESRTEAYELQSITLKLFDTYGPDDPRNKVFALFRRATANGEPLLMSPGEQKLDLVYIEDVIAAFHCAEGLLNSGNCNGCTYALGSDKRLTLRQIASLYQQIVGKQVPIQWGKRSYREREVLDPWQGPSLPGWEPKIDLEIGIKLMEGFA